MLQAKQQILSGWNQFPPKQCTVFRPEREREVEEILLEHPASVIARGMGKSYGDASLNREGVMLTERLNRFILFDEDKGLLRVQAGVTLHEILNIIVPKGWCLPVMPGTRFVSVGGCVASNVHGKNQYHSGEFASHVVSLKLCLANRHVVECSARVEPDIFWATAGGMGMTGIIEEVTLKLVPISSAKMQVEKKRVPHLLAMLDALREAVGSAEYAVGWMDHLAQGRALGRGVIETAQHVKKKDGTLKEFKLKEPSCSVPFTCPAWLLNKWTMALYNAWHFNSVKPQSKKHFCSFEQFFHPLDNIKDWYKLYGSEGFLQYQCLIPESGKAEEQIRHILTRIHQAGAFSSLAVIKYHGPGEGIMTFSKSGFSIALDFHNNEKVHQLLEALDEYLCEIGGRVYLAKDARLKPHHFARMYEDDLPRWRKCLRQLDPKGKIQSSMGRRLQFRGS